MELRSLDPRDRAPLAAMLRRISSFTPEEASVALELIDEALKNRDSNDYQFIVACERTPTGVETVLGYICFGRTPMTQKAYDLYWIAVDPDLHGKGIGRRLHEAFIERLNAQGGGVIRVETSSQESYDGTLAFYARQGYAIAGRITDFYAEGDDLVILSLRI